MSDPGRLCQVDHRAIESVKNPLGGVRVERHCAAEEVRGVDVPEHERGVRYNDPEFKLRWPAAPIVISDKDKSHRDFDAAWHLGR